MIALQLLQVEKGGKPEVVRESQRKRFASVELVDEVLSLYKHWVTLEFQLNQMQQEVNAIQKVITTKKKAKEDADAELAQKKEQDAKIADIKPKVAEAEREMRLKAGTIGCIVGDQGPGSEPEDVALVTQPWGADGPRGL